MKTNYIYLIAFALITIICGCEKEKDNPLVVNSNENSFLPMHIGNYWKINAENYTEITDTLTINGDIYFEFVSLTGGDVLSTQYLRIDNDQNLIESYPEHPELLYTHAKFNANLNDAFYTLNDGTVNDYKVKVVKKDSSIIRLKFEMVYHPGLNGTSHTVTYIKGAGWEDNWNEVRINGKTYK